MNAFEVLKSVYDAGGQIKFSKEVGTVKAKAVKGSKKDIRSGGAEYTTIEVRMGGYHVQDIVDGTAVPFFFLAKREDVALAIAIGDTCRCPPLMVGGHAPACPLRCKKCKLLECACA